MSRAAKPFTVKGWHVAAGVTAFFAIVMAVDGAFMVLAYRTHPGQVADKPYEDGLIYNARLAQERAQVNLGWRAAAAAQGDQVVVWMRDREGRPLDGLEVSATLERPATEQGRVTVRLAETEPGRYASAPSPRTGAWDARIVARSDDGRIFEANRRLAWP